MTRAGFPHSDILGSRFVCQLPEAYRRLPRPSSAPSAKASTLCPYKLDHKDHSKRCSRPLCSSQATTGHRIESPAPSPTRGSGTTSTTRPAGQDPTTRPHRDRSPGRSPEFTTFRLFPQDPTACQANPEPPVDLRSLPTASCRRTRSHQHPVLAVVDVPPSSTITRSFAACMGLDTLHHP
jgi:hypothetical protein